MCNDLIFVYGKLRRHNKNPIAAYLRMHSDFIGRACFQGILYEVNGYPGAVPSARSEDRVTGELFRLHKPARTFTKLDEFEQCLSSHPRPHEYIRRKVKIKTQDNQTTSAWIYIYNHATTNLRQIRSGDYRHKKPY